MCNLFCVYLDIYNRYFDVWFCCMSLASVGIRPNVSSPNLHCTLISRRTIARRRLRRCTPHPSLPMPAPVTFLSLLPWHGPNLSFVTLPSGTHSLALPLRSPPPLCYSLCVIAPEQSHRLLQCGQNDRWNRAIFSWTKCNIDWGRTAKYPWAYILFSNAPIPRWLAL